MKKSILLAVALGGAFITSLTFTSTANATSFGIDAFNTDLLFNMSCNTVSSEKGYLVLGNRGSAFTNSLPVSTNFPCNYRDTGNGYSPAGTPSNPSPGTTFKFNTSGNLTQTIRGNYYNNYSDDLDDQAYINNNFKTSLWRIRTDIGSHINNGTTESFLVPAQAADNYTSRMVVIAGLIPYNTWKNFSIPEFIFNSNGNLYWNRNTATAFSATENDNFNEAFRASAYSNLGNPKDHITDSMYDLIKNTYNITSDDSSTWERFFYYVATFPQYSESYYVNNFAIGCGALCENTYPSELKFDFGYGMNHEDAWTADFLTMSQSYKLNGSFYLDEYNKWNTFVIYGLDTEAMDIMRNLTNINTQAGYQNNAGWNDINYNNPGTSWWDGIFNLSGIIFPFRNFFGGFTNNQCVNIPVIAGMLGLSSNTSYCSWWGSGVRNILTPVFNVASMILLGGFIIHWLRKDNTDQIGIKEAH